MAFLHHTTGHGRPRWYLEQAGLQNCLTISTPSKPKSTSLYLFRGGTKCTVSTCDTLMTLLHEFYPFDVPLENMSSYSWRNSTARRVNATVGLPIMDSFLVLKSHTQSFCFSQSIPNITSSISPETKASVHIHCSLCVKLGSKHTTVIVFLTLTCFSATGWIDVNVKVVVYVCMWENILTLVVYNSAMYC